MNQVTLTDIKLTAHIQLTHQSNKPQNCQSFDSIIKELKNITDFFVPS